MGICNSKRAIQLEDDGSEDVNFEKVLDSHRRSGMTMMDDSDSSNERAEYIERVEYLPPKEEEMQPRVGPPETIVTDELLRRPSTEQEWAETVASIRNDQFLMSEEEAANWESSDDDDISIDSSDDNDDIEEPALVGSSSLQPEAEWQQKDFSSGIIQKRVIDSQSSSMGSSSYEEVTVNSNVDPAEEDDFEKNSRSFGDMAHNDDGAGSDTNHEEEEEVSTDHYSAYITEQRRRASDYSYDDFLAGEDTAESSYEEITVNDEGSFMEVTVSSNSADGWSRLNAPNGLHVPHHFDSGGFNPYNQKRNDDDVYNGADSKSLSNPMVFDLTKPHEPMASSISSNPSSSPKTKIREAESELDFDQHEFNMMEESGSVNFFHSFAWDSIPIIEETPSQIESSAASTSVKQYGTKPPLSPTAKHFQSPWAGKSGQVKSNRPSLNNSISSLSERDLVQFLGLTPPASSKTLKSMEPMEANESKDGEKESHMHISSSPTATKKKKSKSKKKSLGEVLEGNNEYYPKMEDDRTFTGLEIDGSEYNTDLSPISLKGFQAISKKASMRELQELLTTSPLHDDEGQSKLGLPELRMRTATSKSTHDGGRTKLLKSKISRKLLIEYDEATNNLKNHNMPAMESSPPTRRGTLKKSPSKRLQESSREVDVIVKTKASKKRSSIKETATHKKEADVKSSDKSVKRKSISKKKVDLKKKPSNNEKSHSRSAKKNGQLKKKKGSSKKLLSSAKSKGEKKSKKKSKLKDTSNSKDTLTKNKASKIKDEACVKPSEWSRSSKNLHVNASGKKSRTKKKKTSSKKSMKKASPGAKLSKSTNIPGKKVKRKSASKERIVKNG